MINLTKHSILRAKERFNLSVKELKRLAIESLSEGNDVFADPVLRPFFLNKIKKFPDTSGIYYHEGILFFFSDDYLTTVYPISFLNEYQGEV